ncbi:NADPH-dependent F420 reductase [Herbiconiux sp. P17]|uniref:NADPH-dependent F420 reductase n=1 Tax=Herbiconiux wuyangfengii TaxID=3342794 RepID=UPI0035B9224B
MKGRLMTGRQQESIGIIGAGPVALALAEIFSAAGHPVTVSSRRPEPTARVTSAGVPVVSFEEASEAEIVVFAVLHSASRELALRLAPRMMGKLVIDVDNAWLPGHYELAGLSADLTEGQWMADLLPQSRVARAFSHIDWNLFARGLARPGYWGAGYAADDATTKSEMEHLIRGVGFVPVSAGSLAASAALDVDGALWSRLLPADRTKQILASV